MIDSPTPWDEGTQASIFLRLRSDHPEVRELSWQEFNDRYAPVVRRFAMRCGMKDYEAGDIVQEVLLGFFRALPRFEYDPKKGRFRAYLKKAALSAVLDHQRRTKRSLSFDPEKLDEEDDNVEKLWEQLWSGQVLQRALTEARQRHGDNAMRAFELTARHGLSGEQAAEELGMSLAAVHQAKSRVSKTARELVEKIRREEG
jgi:RNA polymerase sigma factor (sigma-70 family)